MEEKNNNIDNKGFEMFFNTGVRPENHLNKNGDLIKGKFEIFKNNQLHIKYYLERQPEKNLQLLYLIPEKSLKCLKPGEIAIKIIDGGMFSDYAIFKKVFTVN